MKIKTCGHSVCCGEELPKNSNWTGPLLLLCFILAVGLIYCAHQRDLARKASDDKTVYIDHGCHGRYQGEEY